MELTDGICTDLATYLFKLQNLKFFIFNSEKVTNNFLSDISVSLINKDKLQGIEFYCKLIGDIGIKNFIHELFKIKTISHLFFSGSNIKYQGVYEIASYLETLPMLLHFGLCSKESGNPESMLLIKPLSIHPELEYAYLGCTLYLVDKMSKEFQQNVALLLSKSNPQTKLFLEKAK